MPLQSMLLRLSGLLTLLSVTSCQQASPSAVSPSTAGPDAAQQSMAAAALVQSVLNCMQDFEASSKDHPEIVALVQAGTFAAFDWKEHPRPIMSSSMQCSFAVAGDTSNGRAIAFPVCKVDASWRAFGSGYGPVVWAKPSFACQHTGRPAGRALQDLRSICCGTESLGKCVIPNPPILEQIRGGCLPFS